MTQALIDTPANWRLRTPYGVPYKHLTFSGQFSRYEGSINWELLIPDSYLKTFLNELFPLPLRFGNTFIPRSFVLNAFPQLVATNASFEPFIEGKPNDVMRIDPGANSETYSKILKMTVEFSPTAEANDPTTGGSSEGGQIQVSSRTSGEFLNVKGRQTKIVPREADPNVPGGAAAAAAAAGGAQPAVDGSGDTTAVRSPEGGTMNIIVPMTEWTIRIPQIPYDFYRDDYIHRLRALQGRVNSNYLPQLFTAFPETILLTGFDYEQRFTWRDGQSSAPVDISIQMIEKRVVDDGLIRGHNDFFDPDNGWSYLRYNGEKPAYEKTDYGILFDV